MPGAAERLAAIAAGVQSRGAAAAAPAGASSAVSHRSSEALQADPQALKRLVVDALDDRGWGSVDPSCIEIEADGIGLGGSKTYKVSAPAGGGLTPTRVALHSRASSLSPESEARTAAAARLFGQAGLAPERLAEGTDWFIEPWEGNGQPTWATVADMRVLGREVAKVHALPIGWFQPFRTQLKEDFPIYADVPDGCHIWWNSCRTDGSTGDFYTAGRDEEWAAAFVQPLFTPHTQAGARIVTCHGDLHAGNMISFTQDCAMEDGSVKFLDLEFAHVSNACSDLGYACFHYEDMPLKDVGIARDPPDAMRRAFLQSYLEATGEPSGERDVDALLIDACLGACGHHFGPCGLPQLGGDMEALARFRQHASELLRSESEQAMFHERGPEGWFAQRGYVQHLQHVHPDNIAFFKFLGRIMAAEP
jgi:hypothetical protein